jgi:hypothetical protein
VSASFDALAVHETPASVLGHCNAPQFQHVGAGFYDLGRRDRGRRRAWKRECDQGYNGNDYEGGDSLQTPISRCRHGSLHTVAPSDESHVNAKGTSGEKLE